MRVRIWVALNGGLLGLNVGSRMRSDLGFFGTSVMNDCFALGLTEAKGSRRTLG